MLPLPAGSQTSPASRAGVLAGSGNPTYGDKRRHDTPVEEAGGPICLSVEPQDFSTVKDVGQPRDRAQAATGSVRRRASSSASRTPPHARSSQGDTDEPGQERFELWATPTSRNEHHSRDPHTGSGKASTDANREDTDQESDSDVVSWPRVVRQARRTTETRPQSEKPRLGQSRRSFSMSVDELAESHPPRKRLRRQARAMEDADKTRSKCAAASRRSTRVEVLCSDSDSRLTPDRTLTDEGCRSSDEDSWDQPPTKKWRRSCPTSGVARGFSKRHAAARPERRPILSSVKSDRSRRGGRTPSMAASRTPQESPLDAEQERWPIRGFMSAKDQDRLSS